MRVVILDKDSLPVPPAPPACATSYAEFAWSSPEQVPARLAGAQVAIINKVLLTADTLARLPELRLIALAATGYDCVDIDYCREHGIAVCNVRGYSRHSVAEHAFAMLLTLRRNLVPYMELATNGAWQRSGQFCLYGPPLADLHGSLLGIIGAGSIGRAAAAIGQGFGMRVAYASLPGRPPGEPERLPLPGLLAAADVVSLHCPSNDATRGMIGARELALMKPNAILVNTARGELVDEAALAAALRAGRIAGAAFDVLAEEPPLPTNPLLQPGVPNFLLTPHVAWASDAAMRTLADDVRANIDAWAQGSPRNLVT
jgi:glycerate dehydrogenase